MARLVYYVNNKYGREQMIAFVRGVRRSQPFVTATSMTCHRSQVLMQSIDCPVYHGK